MNAITSTEPVSAEDDGTCYRLLVASVLQRAVIDVVQYRGSEDKARKALYKDAWNWLFRDDRDVFDSYGVTFMAACAILDQECNDVREHIRSVLRGDRHILAAVP